MQRVYVGNLSSNTTEEQLGRLFARHGVVASVQLMREPGTQQPRGFGFVEMASVEDAVAALHNAELDGRTLTVHPARPREEREELES